MDQDMANGQSRRASASMVTVEREQEAQPPYVSENDPVLKLLREWLDDDSGYDDEVWPKLDEALKRDRLHIGDRTHSSG
jgi:hypothetical protein